MYFSLLCPTKGRPYGIRRLIASVYNMTDHLEDVEILFAHDTGDDLARQEIDSSIGKYGALTIKRFERAPSDWINRDFYDYLAEKSEGEFVQAVGDDIVFMTKGWDTILKSKIESYFKTSTDRVLYISIEDSTPPPNPKDPPFCCFPFLSKEARQVLGFYLHPTVPTWGADQSLYWVMANPAVDRVLVVPEVVVDHISYHTKKAPMDATSQSTRQKFLKEPNAYVDCCKNIIPSDIARLSAHIRRRSSEALSGNQR